MRRFDTFLCVVATLLIIFYASAEAASFNCANATTVVENRVCGDEGLSRLDDELGSLYTEAMHISAIKQRLKSEQLKWLKERASCFDNFCLSRIYKIRINRLIYYINNASDPNKEEYSKLCTTLKKMSALGRLRFLKANDFKEFWYNQEASDGTFKYGGRVYVLTYHDKTFEEIHAVSYWREEDQKLYRLCFFGDDSSDIVVKDPSGDGSYTWDYTSKFYYKKYLTSLIKKPTDAVGVGKYFVMGRSRWLKSDHEGLDMCDRLAENFNSFPDEQAMICKLKFRDSWLDVGVPKWSDVGGDERAIHKVVKLLEEKSDKYMTDYAGSFSELVKEKKLSVLRAEFDFNSDGVADEIFQIQMLRSGYSCNHAATKKMYNSGRPYYRYVIVDGSGDDSFVNVNGKLLGGVFLYRGMPYTHRWGYADNPAYGMSYDKDYKNEPRISIYKFSESQSGKVRGPLLVCDIGYAE